MSVRNREKEQQQKTRGKSDFLRREEKNANKTCSVGWEGL